MQTGHDYLAQACLHLYVEFLALIRGRAIVIASQKERKTSLTAECLLQYRVHATCPLPSTLRLSTGIVIAAPPSGFALPLCSATFKWLSAVSSQRSDTRDAKAPLRISSVCPRAMGALCARRQRENHADLGWEFIEPLPSEVQGNIIQLLPRHPAQVLADVLRRKAARRKWVSATLKILLIKKLRTRWSRAGAWLNVYRQGSIDGALRAQVARCWATVGNTILRQLNSRALFGHLSRSRLANAEHNHAIRRGAERGIYGHVAGAREWEIQLQQRSTEREVYNPTGEAREWEDYLSSMRGGRNLD